jgi:di/tricarboxylate transporter
VISLSPGLAEGAVFLVLALTLVGFVSGVWRYDVVAMLAALVLFILGIIPGDRLFAGFGHPAVITVAAVLVVGHGLQNSGLVALLATWMQRAGERPTAQVGALSTVVAASSAFMNNVGALALFLPVTVRLARKSGLSASILLMPLAFASLFGGMVTLVGTPPNIIIATFRPRDAGGPFGMFAFAPVGLALSAAGILFISLVGWRLLPRRDPPGEGGGLFDIQEYMTEVRVPEGSPLDGTPLRALEQENEGDVLVVALVRNERRVPAPAPHEVIRIGDVLILEADSQALEELTDRGQLELTGSGSPDQETLSSEEVRLLEVVVRPDSRLVGRSAGSLGLRWRDGVSVLAVSRRGSRISRRLAQVRFEAGDVLLMQMVEEEVEEKLASLGVLPLAERELSVGRSRRILLAVGIFGAAIALTTADLLPVTVSFSLAAVLMVTTGLIRTRDLYRQVDLAILVLLAAMLPVGEALESSGGADRIAGWVLSLEGSLPPWATLAIILLATMLLTNVINNAAAVVLMAPIALTVAAGLQVSPDPFLMGVAVGGSAAFLTPIGHQSNLLVMGPGGYRFTDYWRMGLPLQILTLALAVPMILLVWPM